jgi:heme-degrading monooxygenase HmoA
LAGTVGLGLTAAGVAELAVARAELGDGVAAGGRPTSGDPLVYAALCTGDGVPAAGCGACVQPVSTSAQTTDRAVIDPPQPRTRPTVILSSLPGSAAMVLEVALIDVQPGSEAAFEVGFREVRWALADSPGCQSIRMTHGIETPTRFVLLVEWDSLDAHEGFRQSERFAIWRGGIGPYFAQPPHVEHFADLSDQT